MDKNLLIKNIPWATKPMSKRDINSIPVRLNKFITPDIKIYYFEDWADLRSGGKSYNGVKAYKSGDIFVAYLDDDDEYYLVNPEGYNYPRYIAKIDYDYASDVQFMMESSKARKFRLK